jgi:hypothetical protein
MLTRHVIRRGRLAVVICAFVALSALVMNHVQKHNNLCAKVRSVISSSNELLIYLSIDDRKPVGVVRDKTTIEKIASSISCSGCDYLDKGSSLALKGTTFHLRCDSRNELYLAHNFVLLYSNASENDTQDSILCRCPDGATFALCESACGQTFQQMIDSYLRESNTSSMSNGNDL